MDNDKKIMEKIKDCFLSLIQKDLTDDNVLYSENDIMRYCINVRPDFFKRLDDGRDSIVSYIKDKGMFHYKNETLYMNIGYSNITDSTITNNEQIVDIGYQNVHFAEKWFPICRITFKESYVSFAKLFDNINLKHKYSQNTKPAYLLSEFINMDTDTVYKLFKSMNIEFLYLVNYCRHYIDKLKRSTSIDNDGCIKIINPCYVTIIEKKYNCDTYIKADDNTIKFPYDEYRFEFKYNENSDMVTLQIFEKNTCLIDNEFSLMSDICKPLYLIKKFFVYHIYNEYYGF